MFCEKCGFHLSDDSKFCEKCGASLQPNNQPAPQQQGGINSLKQYTPLIAVGLAVIALIFAIIILFNLFDVTATVSMGGFGSASDSGPVADVIEGGEMGSISVGNVIFGLILVVIAAVGGLFFAKKFGVKIYDSLTSVPLLAKESPLFGMGVLGAIGAVIHFICFLCAGKSEGGFSLSISTPWFTWVLLVLFAGIAVLEKFVFNKKK